MVHLDTLCGKWFMRRSKEGKKFESTDCVCVCVCLQQKLHLYTMLMRCVFYSLALSWKRGVWCKCFSSGRLCRRCRRKQRHFPKRSEEIITSIRAQTKQQNSCAIFFQLTFPSRCVHKAECVYCCSNTAEPSIHVCRTTTELSLITQVYILSGLQRRNKSPGGVLL